MNLSDLRAKAEQLGVDKAVKQAVDKAAELAANNRNTVSSWVDKAGKVVDEKTSGKYHDTIVKAQHGVATGVDKLASRHPATAATPPVDPGAPMGTAPVDTTPLDTPPVDTPPVDPSAPGR